jgi:signal transduction histidine kinase
MPRLLFSIFSLLAAFFFSASAVQAAKLPRHDILVVHSYHCSLQFSTAVNQGISQVLLAKDRNDIELHVEYLDGLHLESERQLQAARRYFKDKFKSQRLTAVIGVGDLAYFFLKQFHTELFPTTPLVFCGLTEFNRRTNQDELISAVFESYDVTATVRIGLDLFPDTRRLVVINDNQTMTGIINQRLVAKALKPFKNRLKIVFFESCSMADLLDRVSALGNDSLVLLMNFTRDINGETFSFERSCRLISAKCKVPILSVWEFYLEQGVLGGRMLDFTRQGKEAGIMVLDLMRGKASRELPIRSTSSNRFVFDYSKLKQFQISYSSLPPGSVVTKEPESVLWKNKALGWTLLSIALALEAVVIILSVNIYRRKKSEAELEKHKDHLEELVEQRTLELTTANEQLQEENIERQKAEDALRESEEILHQLSERLFSAQEDERRRISVELHDELGQSLAALKLQLRALRSMITNGRETEILIRECEELRDSINMIIENARRLSRDLSPVALDDLGIDPALDYLISNFSKLHQIETSRDLIEINHFFDQNGQRMLYRILQEILNNIGKHSGADHVFFQIEKKRGNVLLLVKDNGCGFDAAEVLNRKSLEGGMGLTAMAERIRTLGGAMEIHSELGQGTEIFVSVPVYQKTEDRGQKTEVG